MHIHDAAWSATFKNLMLYLPYQQVINRSVYRYDIIYALYLYILNRKRVSLKWIVSRLWK